MGGSMAASYYPNLSALLQSIFLGVLNVLVFLIGNYNSSIVGAVMPPEIVGFSFAFQGY